MSKRDEGYNISDTGNWNVASDYSRLKIMKPLYQADEYSTIALFGVLDPDQSQNVNLEVSKLKGFKRLIGVLVLLINNTKFAVGTDKKKLEDYETELRRIDKLFPALYKVKTNQVKNTKHVAINYKVYDKVLERVLQIKALINEPLNKYDLIFTHKEDFDPQKYKQDIFDKATKLG